VKTLLETSVLVGHPSALHARVAATVVKMAAEAADDLGVKLTIRYKDRVVPAENVLALVALGIRRGDTVGIRCELGPSATPEVGEQVVERIRGFLSRGETDGRVNSSDAVDEIIHRATVTLDRVVDNLANGLVVVNDRNEIILINRAAEQYLGLEPGHALGRRADEVIPNSRLAHILKTGRPETAQRQMAGGITLVTNRTPIWVEDRVIGAAAVFQDITELERLAGELREVKAVRSEMRAMLDAVSEGVCAVLPNGTVYYANAAFRRLFGDPPRWNPDGPLAHALLTGESSTGKVAVTPSGARIIEDVRVVRVDSEVTAAVAICRSEDVVRDLAGRLEREEARAAYLEQELVRSRPLTPPFARLVGRSSALRDALSVAAKAAPTMSTMLIRGESGTGKELVAEAIHEASPRAGKPLVRLNCAAIPATLVESELFGHEKGAFTGAVKRRLGKFELANGGSIFLDEIGTLDLPLQAKLLRVLQNKVLERVGGEESIRVDVRVIAATNSDLEAMVAQGEFREDLYYRLNVIGVFLPPLRDRRTDIPLLVEHFVGHLSQQLGREVAGFTPEALRLLMSYDWPGNVRQLMNAVERAITLSEGPFVDVGDLPPYLRQPATSCTLINPLPTGEVAPMDVYEREIVRLALARHGSFNAAAKALGMTHRTIALKARRFGLVNSALGES